MNNDVHIFKPILWRWIVYHWLFSAFAMTFSICLITLFQGKPFNLAQFQGFLTGITIVVILYPRLANICELWKIIIDDHYIEGPGKRPANRHRFDLNEIDRQKTFGYSLINKLFCINYIYFKNGQRIYVNKFFFGTEQVNMLRSMIDGYGVGIE